MIGALTDARFAVRTLRRNPTFVILAVLCLGLGIGASTLTFTAVHHALLEPLGPVDPDGLVVVAETQASAPNQWAYASWANFLDWRDAVAEQTQMSALRPSAFVVGPDGADARVEGAYVTGNLFAVLGVAPLLGPGFGPGADAPGAEPVVVLSENYWRQRFGGDRAIVGRVVPIDGTAHTVVGVAPALLDVGIPGVIRSARLWVPIGRSTQSLARSERSLFVLARLADGVGVEAFAARLESVANDLAAAYPEDAGWSVAVAPVEDTTSTSDRNRSMLLLSLAAALLVLLIASANVANLTLAYSIRRRHEFGVRTALGAAPSRLAVQLLCETLLVAAAGAVLGLVLAQAGLGFVVQSYEADTLAPTALPIDVVSLAFTIGVTVVTTVLCGLAPALHTARRAARTQIVESASGATAARTQIGLRRGLVVGQVAASLVLLIGAALLSRSFVNLLAVDGGVDTDRTISIRVEPLAPQPAAGEDASRYVERMLETLAALPGIETAAASATLLPLRGGVMRSSVDLPAGAPAPSTRPVIAYAGVTPSFFTALDIPILRGQGLVADRSSDQVAVVNERLADFLWPGRDALGKQFRLDAAPERGLITVIGVSGNVLTWDSSGNRPLPTAYLDLKSFDVFPIFFFIRQRSAEQVTTAASIVRAIESLGIPLRRIVVTPMETVARDPFWRQRLFGVWLSVFGVAALVLTAVGLYGVLAYLVWQRWRELGIRLAVGANRRAVFWLVLRQSGAWVGSGIAVGLVGAYVLARAFRTLLFGVEPLDLPLFVAVTAGLAAVALTASIVPAVRAARIEPSALLRT